MNWIDWMMRSPVRTEHTKANRQSIRPGAYVKYVQAEESDFAAMPCSIQVRVMMNPRAAGELARILGDMQFIATDASVCTWNDPEKEQIFKDAAIRAQKFADLIEGAKYLEVGK